MAHVMHRSFRSRAAVAILAGSLLGGFLGYASAQDRTSGALDSQCASECTEHGYDPEFCGQACWIPDPEMAARGSRTDWQCMANCRAAGGGEEDCRQRCKRR